MMGLIYIMYAKADFKELFLGNKEISVSFYWETIMFYFLRCIQVAKTKNESLHPLDELNALIHV